MAGFHPPGDPYYPNQGNGGWVEDDPEEDEEPIELEEGDGSGTDSEPEVINPPVAQPPAVRRNFQGPTPICGSHSTIGVNSKECVLHTACVETSMMSVAEVQPIEHFQSWWAS